MILPDDHPDRDDVPDLGADDDEDEEWLRGLRRLGVPVRADAAHGGGVAPSAGLRQLLDKATPAVASPALRDLIANSVAPTTRAAYEKDWLDFDVFCRAGRHGDPLDATAVMVGEYVNEMVRDRRAYSTITRRLAAISFCQRLATGSTVARDPLVTTALQGARRLLAGRGTRQAAPLRLADMRSIITALPIVAPGRPSMRRDQLIVALGWASALRASELVNLDVEDLTVVGDPNISDGGLLVRVRTGKAAHQIEWVAVPFSTHVHTCPVRPHHHLHRIHSHRAGVPPHRPARATSAPSRRPPGDRHRASRRHRDAAVRRRRLQLPLPSGRLRHRGPRPRRARRADRPPHPPRPGRWHPQRLRPAHPPLRTAGAAAGLVVTAAGNAAE
jgi:integrase